MDLKNKRILLVEDEALIALAEARTLEREGYRVVRVASGEAALAAVEGDREGISLVLMDINLGAGIDGAEAARRILASRSLPILFLSSHTEPEVVRLTEEIGSYGYVVKSAGETVLLAAIRMAFRLHAARLELEAKGEELIAANEELAAAYEELQATNEEYQVVNEELIRAQAFLEASRREALASEERFRRLVEGAPFGLFIQTGGRFAYLNPAALSLFGAAEPGALVGREVADFFDPAFRDKVRERIRLLNEEGLPVPLLEERILGVDGGGREVEVSAVPFARGGEAGALVYLYDITERKAALRELAEREELLSLVGCMAKVGGWEFDAATGKGSWTEEVARIHGLDPAAATELSLGLSFYEGESRARIEAAVRAAIEEGRAYDLELEMRDARGERKWVHTVGRPLPGPNGRTAKVRGTFQDISRVKRVEGELRASLAEKELLFREIRHRMKNYLELAAGMIGLEQPRLERGPGSRTLENLRMRLLAMARAYDRLGESGAAGAVRVDEYLSELLRDLSAAFSPASGGTRIRPRIEAAAVGIEKAVPLGLIVNELVTNAFKHAYAEGNFGEIEVSLGPAGPGFELRVADGGGGFPPGFDPASSGGTGFLIVRALAEQIGAGLEFRSEAGKGASISLRFSP